MISLKISEDWKKRFVQEMYANDKYYDEFIDDDIVRAYYFGFFIQDVCEEMQSDGFKTGEPDEQLTPMKWAVRRYKPQLVFWKKKYVDTYGEMVILSEMDAYILNKIVVDSDDDLLRIATCLGRDSYVTVRKAQEEKQS